MSKWARVSARSKSPKWCLWQTILIRKLLSIFICSRLVPPITCRDLGKNFTDRKSSVDHSDAGQHYRTVKIVSGFSGWWMALKAFSLKPRTVCQANTQWVWGNTYTSNSRPFLASAPGFSLPDINPKISSQMCYPIYSLFALSLLFYYWPIFSSFFPLSLVLFDHGFYCCLFLLVLAQLVWLNSDWYKHVGQGLGHIV